MFRLATPLSAIALVGATVALAACGGSSGGSSAASTTGTTATGTATTPGAAGGTQSAALQKFTQCLKDNGVTLPQRGAGGGAGGGGGRFRGGAGGGGTGTNGTPPTGTNGTRPPGGGGFANNPKLQKAMQACAKLRPQGAGGFGGGGGTGRPGGGQQSIKAFTPYLTCLKDKGLDVKVSDGFNALRGLKQSDPKVQAALKSCQSKIPQRPQGAPGQAPGGGTGTTAGSPS